MKEGWKNKKFSEICSSIEDGDWIESKDQSQSGIRLVQTGNVGIGIYKNKGERAKYISEDTFKRLHCNEIFDGDILISRLPDPVGRACILPRLETRCITAVDCSILRIKEEVVLSKWFVLYTQSDKYFSLVKSQCTGSTRLRITRKKLAELEIPIPPLSTQQEIVTYLDTAFEKIDRLKENAEKAVEDAKALFQSALKEMMMPREGWEEKTIKEIGTVVGGTTPSTTNKEFWGGNNCWISPAELDGCHYLYDSVKKITDLAVQSKSLKLLPVGTVILSSRAPIGKVTINKVPTYCNQGFKCVICGEYIFNEFLYWWFLGNTQYLNSLGTGATFKEISKTVVENISIPVPPLTEQEDIASTLDALSEKVSTLEKNYTRTKAECSALKQALLKQVFE